MEKLACQFCLHPSPYSSILDCGHTICNKCIDYQLKTSYSEYKEVKTI